MIKRHISYFDECINWPAHLAREFANEVKSSSYVHAFMLGIVSSDRALQPLPDQHLPLYLAFLDRALRDL
jgi:hypothetical protein